MDKMTNKSTSQKVLNQATRLLISRTKQKISKATQNPPACHSSSENIRFPALLFYFTQDKTSSICTANIVHNKSGIYICQPISKTKMYRNLFNHLQSNGGKSQADIPLPTPSQMGIIRRYNLQKDKSNRLAMQTPVYTPRRCGL